MANITVKNIPNDLYERLKDVAANNHRSLNNEIIVCIKKAVQSRKIDKEESLDRIRKLRDSTKLPPLTNERLTQVRDEGRL